jgi:hypothetical protein
VTAIITEELLSQARVLREAGVPDTEIAKRLNVHRSTLFNQLGPSGRPSGPPRINKLDTDGNPPPCRHCGCCPMYFSSSTGVLFQCNRCSSARLCHGFENHREYDDYLAQGCWVCGMPADRIDHDHARCPRSSHSCALCRRGPVCARCNSILVAGATANMLFTYAKKYQAQADANYRAAEALARVE